MPEMLCRLPLSVDENGVTAGMDTTAQLVYGNSSNLENLCEALSRSSCQRESVHLFDTNR